MQLDFTLTDLKDVTVGGNYPDYFIEEAFIEDKNGEYRELTIDEYEAVAKLDGYPEFLDETKTFNN